MFWTHYEGKGNKYIFYTDKLFHMSSAAGIRPTHKYTGKQTKIEYHSIDSNPKKVRNYKIKRRHGTSEIK